MKAKNVLIIGDSYSTFRGIIPDHYNSYYGPNTDPNYPDVNKVEYTWWHQLATEMDLNIVHNNSWSGSTVCYAGQPGEKTYLYAFVYRLELLVKEDFFEKNDIDTVFVFGGTNDSWRELPLGEDKFENITEDDLHSYRPAMCKLLGRLREILPNGNILAIINNELKPEIGECIKNACAHYGTNFVELHDIDKVHKHPTRVGMIQIKEQVKPVLEAM